MKSVIINSISEFPYPYQNSWLLLSILLVKYLLPHHIKIYENVFHLLSQIIKKYEHCNDYKNDIFHDITNTDNF